MTPLSSYLQTAVNSHPTTASDSPPPQQIAGNLEVSAAAAILMADIQQLQTDMSNLSTIITNMQTNYANAIQGTPVTYSSSNPPPKTPTTLNEWLAKLQYDVSQENSSNPQSEGAVTADSTGYGGLSAQGQEIQKAFDGVVQVVQGFLSQLPSGEQQFIQFMQTVNQGMSFISGLLSK